MEVSLGNLNNLSKAPKLGSNRVERVQGILTSAILGNLVCSLRKREPGNTLYLQGCVEEFCSY